MWKVQTQRILRWFSEGQFQPLISRLRGDVHGSSFSLLAPSPSPSSLFLLFCSSCLPAPPLPLLLYFSLCPPLDSHHNNLSNLLKDQIDSRQRPICHSRCHPGTRSPQEIHQLDPRERGAQPTWAFSGACPRSALICKNSEVASFLSC